MKLEDPKYWHDLINQSLVRFFLLKVLRQEPHHGYVLSKVIEEASLGFCHPTQSTLYPALAELEKGGYVKVTVEQNGNRKKKIYTLTVKGKDAYVAAAKIWGEIIPMMNRASTL
jgi:DNA-binding PadR family transcriptional regulator